jgi:two-component system, NarL family, nitrate/nitrite response regulator NarL
VSDRLELALYCLHHQLHKNAAEADSRPVEISAQP